MYSAIIGLIMILALVGIIVCVKKQRTNPNAQPIAVGLLIVVVACGIALVFLSGTFVDTDKTVAENETQYACVK
ncbi:MAG: hypothetical protein PHQ27_09055, partial [Victivallales bacterium]|nr:hypothetical protein [Victivallales bacterium]